MVLFFVASPVSAPRTSKNFSLLWPEKNKNTLTQEKQQNRLRLRTYPVPGIGMVLFSFPLCLLAVAICYLWCWCWARLRAVTGRKGNCKRGKPSTGRRIGCLGTVHVRQRKTSIFIRPRQHLRHHRLNALKSGNNIRTSEVGGAVIQWENRSLHPGLLGFTPTRQQVTGTQSQTLARRLFSSLRLVFPWFTGRGWIWVSFFFILPHPSGMVTVSVFRGLKLPPLLEVDKFLRDLI